LKNKVNEKFFSFCVVANAQTFQIYLFNTILQGYHWNQRER